MRVRSSSRLNVGDIVLCINSDFSIYLTSVFDVRFYSCEGGGRPYDGAGGDVVEPFDE